MSEKQNNNIEKTPRVGKNGNNLKVVKKGDPSPNPNGRPKGSKNRSTIIRKFFEATMPGKNPISGQDETLTVEDRVILSVIGQALHKGNIQAAQFLFDNLYGKLKDKMEIETRRNIELSDDEINSRLRDRK